MFWSIRGEALLLKVRLTPNGGADRIDGPRDLSDGSSVLAARVRAIPEDGAANEALVRLVAGVAGAPKSRVSVVAGQTARIKTVRIEGDAALLQAAVQKLGGSGSP